MFKPDNLLSHLSRTTTFHKKYFQYDHTLNIFLYIKIAENVSITIDIFLFRIKHNNPIVTK